MAKYNAVLSLEGDRPRRQGSGRGLVLGVATLASLPLLYEWALTVYARWRTMLGTEMAVRTPIWDWLGGQWESARQMLRYQTPTLISLTGASPPAILGTLVALAVFGVLFLRRGT